jgi:hypothetical protein
VLADEVTRTVRANLSGDLGAIYQVDALRRPPGCAN